MSAEKDNHRSGLSQGHGSELAVLRDGPVPCEVVGFNSELRFGRISGVAPRSPAGPIDVREPLITAKCSSDTRPQPCPQGLSAQPG